jgi:hypothetical protein
MFKSLSRVLLLIFSEVLLANAQSDPTSALAQLLAEKGVITNADLARISAAPQSDKLNTLTALLQEKGILSGADLARISPSSTAPISPAATAPQAIAQTKGTEPPVSRPAPPPTLDTSFKTGRKLPVSLYGTLLFNAGYNTAGGNIEDVPLFLGKQNSDPTGGDKNFYGTVRQTRIGLSLNPVNTLGGKLSGIFEFDMFGGQTALPTGTSMNLFRMRHAYGRLEWNNVAVEAGQDWGIFAPLNPISFSEYGIPALSASGNSWARMPQLRVEVKNAGNRTNNILWQFAASDPNMGDYPTTLFSTSRTPLIGERGRMPALQTRLAYSRVHNDRRFTVGLSGHYGRGKNAGTIGVLNVQSPVDSWGVALDYSLPLTTRFTIVGEAYEGRALGVYSSPAGEAVGAVGTAGAHGVDSRGGWSQAQWSFAKQWQLNLGYGIDAPNASQLPVGNRTRNQTYMGNLIYKLTLNVNLALEYRRLLTDYRNQTLANERGDHIDLAVAYLF